nr:MAG TPA: hypothetical protein [Bacteriophage sp.]
MFVGLNCTHCVVSINPLPGYFNCVNTVLFTHNLIYFVF